MNFIDVSDTVPPMEAWLMFKMDDYYIAGRILKYSPDDIEEMDAYVYESLKDGDVSFDECRFYIQEMKTIAEYDLEHYEYGFSEKHVLNEYSDKIKKWAYIK